MTRYYFIINFISYLFLFILFFLSVSYKNVIFTVNFTKESEASNLLIKAFRKFLFKTIVLFFLVSVSLNNFLYFGLLNFLYFGIVNFKYLSYANEVKKQAFSSSEITKNTDRFLYLDYYDLILSFFLTIYNFYIVFEKRLSEDILFSKSLYIIPLTLFFLNLFAFFTIKLIQKGSDFKVKEVKGHIINILVISSITISYIFIVYSQFVLKSLSVTAFINSLFVAILSVIYLIIYIRYINSINKGFLFNVENGKITTGKVIEINLRGTKLFINFKNKKSYLLLIGFIVFILSYIWLVYLLTI